MIILKKWLQFKQLILPLTLLFTLSFAVADVGDDFAKEYGYFPDYAAYQRVVFIGNRLAYAAGVKNASFQIINDDSYNAFAFPDGRMFVTSRLLMDATDGEIAFIMGHEVTHVVEKHSEKQNNTTVGAILAGYIGTKAVGGEDGDALLVGVLTGMLVSGQYSQKDELRADAGGIRYMSMLGYDPKEAVSGMKLLLDRYGRGEATVPILGLFASHPDTQKRYDELQIAADKYKNNPPKMVDYVHGVTLEIDPDSIDKDNWLIDYAIIILSDVTQGHLAVIPEKGYNPPQVPSDLIRSKNKNIPIEYKQTLYAISTYVKAYDLSLLTRVINNKTVEVAVSWKHRTGNSGIVYGKSSSKNATITGRAADELKNPARQLFALSDGINDNVEGTVAAAALRRAFRVFNDIVENDGKDPDIKRDFEVKLSSKNYAEGNYVYIVRNKSLIGEAEIVNFSSTDKANIKLIWGLKVGSINASDTFAKADI